MSIPDADVIERTALDMVEPGAREKGRPSSGGAMSLTASRIGSGASSTNCYRLLQGDQEDSSKLAGPWDLDRAASSRSMNWIADVNGVRVGHSTIIRGIGCLRIGQG